MSAGPQNSDFPTTDSTLSASALYVTHGGGPLPLLGDLGHREIVALLTSLGSRLVRPSAIVIVSAHWEAAVASVTASAQPELIYDYSGFPESAYHLSYPAPGDPALARQIVELLSAQRIDARLDTTRGYDHGMFVPLKLMYPDASIPCVQLSLVRGLNPTQHLVIGAALATLRQQNVLLLGSGSSFHNMQAFFQPQTAAMRAQNLDFEHWLTETCTSTTLDEAQRRERLAHWDTAPGARYCHPREEHLIPLHVCYGYAGTAAQQAFALDTMKTQTSAFLWS